MRHRLRLYTGDEESVATKTTEPQVTVRLEEFAQALADAVHWKSAWLEDFAGDEVRMSADLYEILTAYRHLRPGA